MGDLYLPVVLPLYLRYKTELKRSKEGERDKTYTYSLHINIS